MPDVPSKKAIGFISHGSGSASFDFDVDTKGEYVLTFVFHKSRAKKKQYMQIDIDGKMHELFFPETKVSALWEGSKLWLNLQAAQTI